MAKAAATRSSQILNLSFWALLSSLVTVMLADNASLTYTFTVGKLGSGSWLQKVQGQKNLENFICCVSNKCHATGVLGKSLEANKIWKRQCDTLKDALDLMKAHAVHMKQENDTTTGHLILQAKIHCQYEANGQVKGTWNLYTNVYSRTGKQPELDSESSTLKEMKANRDITTFLNKTSQGDCRSWLEEFKSHREEKMEPPVSPNPSPDVDQSSSMVRRPSALVYLLTFILLVLLKYLQ